MKSIPSMLQSLQNEAVAALHPHRLFLIAMLYKILRTTHFEDVAGTFQSNRQVNRCFRNVSSRVHFRVPETSDYDAQRSVFVRARRSNRSGAQCTPASKRQLQATSDRQRETRKPGATASVLGNEPGYPPSWYDQTWDCLRAAVPRTGDDWQRALGRRLPLMPTAQSPRQSS